MKNCFKKESRGHKASRSKTANKVGSIENEDVENPEIALVVSDNSFVCKE